MRGWVGVLFTSPLSPPTHIQRARRVDPRNPVRVDNKHRPVTTGSRHWVQFAMSGSERVLQAVPVWMLLLILLGRVYSICSGGVFVHSASQSVVSRGSSEYVTLRPSPDCGQVQSSQWTTRSVLCGLCCMWPTTRWVNDGVARYWRDWSTTI